MVLHSLCWKESVMSLEDRERASGREAELPSSISFGCCGASFIFYQTLCSSPYWDVWGL